MQSKIFTSLTDEIYQQWESSWLKSPHANYTNSPYWFKSILEQFDYKKCVIIVILKNEIPIGFAGLVRVKKYGISVYTVAPNDYVCGVPFLFDITDRKVSAELYTCLERLGTVFLDNVPESFIKAMGKTSHTMDSHKFSANYYLPLKLNENGVVEFASRKRFLRRIKHAPEKFTLHTCTCKNKDCIVKAFTIDAVSTKHMYGYNCFSSNFMKNFYKRLARQFKDNFRLDILYFENTPIAYEIGFVSAGTYYENQCAYIGEYQQYAPGNVITTYLLDAIAKDGVTKADFGSGDTHKKRLITQEYENLYKVTISKNSVIRLHFHNLDKTKSSLYQKVEKNKKVYSFYRKVKNISHNVL